MIIWPLAINLLAIMRQAYKIKQIMMDLFNPLVSSWIYLRLLN